MEGANKMKNFKEPHIVKLEKRMYNEPPKESNVAYIGSPFYGKMVKIEFVRPKKSLVKRIKGRCK